MIYTLTVNPAIDMNIATNQKLTNQVNRIDEAIYSPNGKGLNISFVLKHFGTDSGVLGFFGGFSGDYIVKETEQRDIPVKPIWVEEPTRINVFLNEQGEEFKLVNKGSFVNEEKQKDLLELLDGLEDMEYLAISGSLPPGIEESYYDEILSICEKKKVEVILDISSPKLKELLKYRPLLIKPNDEELKEVFNLTVRDEADIQDVLVMLHEKGAQNILLTMGEKGSYFYNGKDTYFTSTYKVTLVSSACAGDSALGSFLSIWLDNPSNVEEALKRSAAVGANVAESNGIGDLANVEKYVKEIKVRKVEPYEVKIKAIV